jgi:hypothetical protein
MKENETERLPRITEDSLPKTIEQQMLAVLKSIDETLKAMLTMRKGAPETPKPQQQSQGQLKRRS